MFFKQNSVFLISLRTSDKKFHLHKQNEQGVNVTIPKTYYQFQSLSIVKILQELLSFSIMCVNSQDRFLDVFVL